MSQGQKLFRNDIKFIGRYFNSNFETHLFYSVNFLIILSFSCLYIELLTKHVGQSANKKYIDVILSVDIHI